MKQNTVVNKICSLVHPKCIVCSSKNARGLHIDYDINDDGSARATFKCDASLEGYPGMVHGGVISSILDGAMGNCMFARGLATVTVEMTTKYKHPVLTKQDATVSAKITRASHPLYLLEAEIVQCGEVKAIATGKYYDQPKLFDSSKMDL